MKDIAVLSIINTKNHIDVHINDRLYTKVTRKSLGRLYEVLNKCAYKSLRMPSECFAGFHMLGVESKENNYERVGLH